METQTKLLVVDDDQDFAAILTRLLREEYEVCTVGSGGACLQLTENQAFGLVLLDLKLPDMDGLTVLRRMRTSNQPAPVVVMTAYGGVQSAISAIRLGAADYVEKPFDHERITRVLRDWVDNGARNGEPPIRREIVGECPQMRAVWRAVETFGPTDLPILLQGETGTGKELFSRAIHELSRRRDRPFVTVDCNTLPESLIDSELFGYEQGAFTGASKAKPGQIEWADGGTLFLDEIGDLSPSSQAKLLRVAENQTIAPLGARGPRLKSVDLRIVSATNRDLGEAVERGDFRPDLFYRLAGQTITLPPLRERGADLELLAEHFLRRYRKAYGKPGLRLSEEAPEALKRRSWPGNVRELKHVLASVAAATEGTIRPEHLQAHFLRAAYPSSQSGSPGNSQMQMTVRVEADCDLSQPIDLKRLKHGIAHRAEMRIVAAAREVHRGNQGELAEFFGIDPKTLWKLLRELDGRLARS